MPLPNSPSSSSYSSPWSESISPEGNVELALHTPSHTNAWGPLSPFTWGSPHSVEGQTTYESPRLYLAATSALSPYVWGSPAAQTPNPFNPYVTPNSPADVVVFNTDSATRYQINDIEMGNAEEPTIHVPEEQSRNEDLMQNQGEVVFANVSGHTERQDHDFEELAEYDGDLNQLGQFANVASRTEREDDFFEESREYYGDLDQDVELTNSGSQSEQQDQRFEKLLEDAQRLYQEGDFKNSISAVSDAIDHHLPASAMKQNIKDKLLPAFELRMLAAIAVKDHNSVINDANIIIKHINPLNWKAQLKKASALLEIHNYKEAIKSASEALVLAWEEPNFNQIKISIHLIRAKAYFYLNEFSKVATEAVEIFRIDTWHSEAREIFYESHCKEQLIAKNFPAVISTSEIWLRSHPNNELAHQYRGLATEYLGNLQNPLVYATTIIENSSNEALLVSAYLLKIKAHLIFKQYELARIVIRTSIEKFPHSTKDIQSVLIAHKNELLNINIPPYETLSLLIEFMPDNNLYIERADACLSLKNYMAGLEDINFAINGLNSTTNDLNIMGKALKIRALLNLNLRNFENTINDTNLILELGLSTYELNRFAREFRGVSQIMLGNFKEAWNDIEFASRNDPGFNRSLFIKGICRALNALAWRSEKKYQNIDEISDLLTKIQPKNYDDYIVYDETVCKVQILQAEIDAKLKFTNDFLKKGEFANAITMLNQLIEDGYSKAPYVYTLLAQAYLGSNEYANALQACLQANTLGPSITGNISLSLIRLQAQWGLKEYKQALIELSNLLNIYPEIVLPKAFSTEAENLLLEYAETNIDQKNHSELIVHANLCLKINPYNITAHIYLGNAKAIMGNYQEALTTATTVISMTTKAELLADGYILKIRCQIMLHDFEDSCNDIEKIYQYDPDFNNRPECENICALLNTKAANYFYEKNYKNLLDAARLLVRINPNNPEYNNLLSLASLFSGRYNDAISYFNKAKILSNPPEEKESQSCPTSYTQIAILVGSTEGNLIPIDFFLPGEHHRFVFPKTSEKLALITGNPEFVQMNEKTLNLLIVTLKDCVDAVYSPIEDSITDPQQKHAQQARKQEARQILIELLSTRILFNQNDISIITAIYILLKPEKKSIWINLIQDIFIREPDLLHKIFYNYQFDNHTLSMLYDWMMECINHPLIASNFLFLRNSENGRTLLEQLVINATPEENLNIFSWIYRDSFSIDVSLFTLAITTLFSLGNDQAGTLALLFVSRCFGRILNTNQLYNIHINEVFFSNIIVDLLDTLSLPRVIDFFSANPENLFNLLTGKDDFNITFPLYITKLLNNSNKIIQLFEFLELVKEQLKIFPRETTSFLHSTAPKTKETFFIQLLQALQNQDFQIKRLRDWLDYILPGNKFVQMITAPLSPENVSDTSQKESTKKVIDQKFSIEKNQTTKNGSIHLSIKLPIGNETVPIIFPTKKLLPGEINVMNSVNTRRIDVLLEYISNNKQDADKNFLIDERQISIRIIVQELGTANQKARLTPPEPAAKPEMSNSY